MIFEEAFTLSNGVTIPKPWLGTWRIKDGAVAPVVGNAAPEMAGSSRCAFRQDPWKRDVQTKLMFG